MSLPPVFAASALYDNLLQAALRQFFGRATFETEADSVAVVGRPARHRADQRSVGADDPLVRIAARAARAGAAAVHRARSAAGAGDRRGARGALPRDLRSASRCSSAASCSGARSRIATSARFSTRWPAPIRRSRAPISSRPASKCCASRRSRATRTVRSRRACSCSTATTIRSRRAAATGDQAYPLFAGAHRDQEFLPAVRRPARRCSSSTARGYVLDIVDIASATHRRPARRAVPDAVPPARAGHRRQPQRLHRPQPVARDQGLRGRRAGLQLPQRALAPARPAGEVRDVGRGGRQRGAGGAAVPDGARSRRRARRRAVRGAARSGGVAAAAGGAGDQLDAPRHTGRRRHADARRSCCTCFGAASATDLDPAVLSGLARTDGATVHGSERTAARRRRHPPAHRTAEPHSTSRSKARARPRRWPPAGSARC